MCQAHVLEARIQGLHLSLAMFCDLGSGVQRVKGKNYLESI